MRYLRYGFITAPILGALWLFVIATTVAVAMSFATGAAFRPSLLGAAGLGALLGLAAIWQRWPDNARVASLAGVAAVLTGAAVWLGIGPVVMGEGVSLTAFGLTTLAVGIGTGWPLALFLRDVEPGALTRHQFEGAVIQFLMGFGYIFFTAIVLIPFYVMVMTSLKNQSELIQNPLDFSVDLSQGWGLFRSYVELVRDFRFGEYMWTSFYISVLTVLITLAFAIPGAYAVARLRFRGQAAFSRSILLIYMVPMIVLALPIYIAFSMTGLRNSILGIVMIYPVTTIPVSLYMLQGYFRGLPSEVEDAGLMDGLTRLQVIWKITLPLSLPALASVSTFSRSC